MKQRWIVQTETEEDWSLCTQTGVLQCLRVHDMRDIWGFNARLSRDKFVCRHGPHEPHIVCGPSNDEGAKSPCYRTGLALWRAAVQHAVIVSATLPANEIRVATWRRCNTVINALAPTQHAGRRKLLHSVRSVTHLLT